MLVFPALKVGARELEFGAVQPRNYTSPSGTYSLFVDPGDRYGNGGAKYRFGRNDVELHGYDKPFTLREVTLTDDGLAAGMAYRSDEDGAEKSLILAILAPDGREILNESKKRELAHLHGPTLPKVHQLFADQDLDRFLVRLQTRSEELWAYKLSTGESIQHIDLRESVGGESISGWAVDAKLVPGTPLLLVHWLTNTPDPRAKDYGAAFALIDVLKGKRVWILKADKDYANVDLKWAPGGFGPRFFDHQSAISTPAPGRFNVRLFSEKKQIAFSVNCVAQDTWEVVELGRINDVEFQAPIPPTSDSPPLKYLGEVTLSDSNKDASRLSGLFDFTFDIRGRIYAVLRKDDASTTMAVLNEKGAVAEERTVPPSTLPRMGRHWNDVPRYKDDRYFQLRKEGESDYTAWSVHLPTGKEEPLQHFPGGFAKSLTRLSDGSLVVLDTYSQQYSPADRLRCFDPDGNLRWELRSNVEKDYEILGTLPWHLTVTTQDNVVLLGSNSLHVLDRDGKHLKKIELTGAFGDNEFGGSPGYLHEVVADADGGFLVANHRNPPIVLRFSADGALRSKWSPRHPDGKTFDLRPQIRVAPDGRLWTGDGSSIMRLTDDGVVDLVLGEQSSTDQLKEIVAFTIDLVGNMYAVDRKTGNIYVFDPGSNPIRMIKPNPADMQGTIFASFVAVNQKGEVFLKKPATRIFMPPDEYLRFSPSGEFMETMTFEPSIPVSQFSSPGWSFQPKTQYRCGMCAIRGDTRLVLVDPPKTLVREQRKRPDARWFGNWTSLAVASDGSIVVLDQDNFGHDAVFELAFFSAQGDPLRTVRLPKSADRYTGLAYDAGRVAIFGKKDAVIHDIASGTITQWGLVPPAVTENEWAAFLRPRSNQILLFDKGKHRVYRYELPDQQAQAVPASHAPQEIPEPEEALAGQEPEWFKELQQQIAAIPLRGPCVVYIKKIEGGEETLSQEKAQLLSEEERAKLRTMSLDDCGAALDSPRVYQRLLEIAALHGLDQIADKRILDIGCCDLRGAQTLARMGANMVKIMAGFSLTAMCNDWKQVGDLAGPQGRSGHLDVPRSLADLEQAKTEKYDLVLARNVIRDPGSDDYSSSPEWFHIGIGWQKDVVAAGLFPLLKPGGILLVYNVGPDSESTRNAFTRELWERVGFQVVDFDKDDRAAAFRIGNELGWDKYISPLESSLMAHYSILKKPSE